MEQLWAQATNLSDDSPVLLTFDGTILEVFSQDTGSQRCHVAAGMPGITGNASRANLIMRLSRTDMVRYQFGEADSPAVLEFLARVREASRAAQADRPPAP